MKPGNPSNSRPRLCFVGPMVGDIPGHVTTQGHIASRLFREIGYSVISTSRCLNRYVRLADIVTTLTRCRDSFDLVVLEVYSGASFVVVDIVSRVCRGFGKPVVMTLHGGGLPAFISRYPVWTSRVLARASLLVAPTEFIARAILPLGFDVEIIPNIIELDDYSYRQREVLRPRLFWMRSFHPAWNPAMAVRVLARLVQEVPDASLIMAGQDKGMLREIQSLAERLGVISKIRFPGFLDMDGKNREGGVSDLYLNTNHIDNMPVAVVEACAMGLPIVATAVGGIPDMLKHGDTGLLVPDNDVEAMVRATRCLLKNPGLAGRLSRNGRMVAQRSAWAQVRPQWETVFENVVSRSGPSGHRGRFRDRLVPDKASLELTSHSPRT